MTSPILIVVEAENWSSQKARIEPIIEKELSLGKTIELVGFVDDWSDNFIDRLQIKYPEKIKFIPGGVLLQKTSLQTRSEITVFVAKLREKLISIAKKTGGDTWAERFASLWWYTLISQKNSPLEACWSDYVRFKATVSYIKDTPAATNGYVFGSPLFCSLLKQFSNTATWEIHTRPDNPSGIFKTLLKRAYAGIGLSYAVWRCRNFSHPNKTDLLALSWPEFWRTRSGVWQDMYYGMIFSQPELADKNTLIALGVYGRALMPLQEIRAQFDRLKKPEWQAWQTVPLESYGSLKLILKEYCRTKDAWAFYQMTKDPDFIPAFKLDSMDLSEMFIPLLWNSVIWQWPYLLCQEEMARTLVKSANPTTTLYYSFEYLAGRAFLKGTQSATSHPAIAMQHGPMTPMKWTYAGDPEETKPIHNTASSRPEASVYLVDGTMGKYLLEESGIPPQKIHAVGASRMEICWQRALNSHKFPRFQNSLTRILVAPGLHDMPFVLHCAFKSLGSSSQFKITVKAHPKTDPKSITDLIENYRQNHPDLKVDLKINEEIYELLDNTDIIVGTYSSVLVEAPFFGVPAVLIQSNRLLDLSPFAAASDQEIFRAKTPMHLKNLLEDLVQKTSIRNEYLKDLYKISLATLGATTPPPSQTVAKEISSYLVKDASK